MFTVNVTVNSVTEVWWRIISPGFVNERVGEAKRRQGCDVFVCGPQPGNSKIVNR